MRIKVLLAPTDRVLIAEVAPESEGVVRAWIEAGLAPAAWVRCANEQGWPFLLNPAHCITVEQAAT